MKHVISGIINRYHYALESIKNRYPCKIISVSNATEPYTEAQVEYQAVTRINIRTSTAQEILADPLLIEKFHPTDGVKLGFLTCGQLLLKESTSLEEAKEKFNLIIEKMFPEVR